VRFRGTFAYVQGQLHDGQTLPLMRLRYGGSAARWGFAIYLASKDGYQDAVLPTGDFAGAPEDALTPPPASTSTIPGLTNPRRTYKPDHLGHTPNESTRP